MDWLGARLDGIREGSYSVFGRPGVYFRSLKFDFRPKLRHSILDASLTRVFTSFSLFFVYSVQMKRPSGTTNVVFLSLAAISTQNCFIM